MENIQKICRKLVPVLYFTITSTDMKKEQVRGIRIIKDSILQEQETKISLSNDKTIKAYNNLP